MRRATMGRFRLALSPSEFSWPTAEKGKEIPDPVLRALRVAEDQRTEAQKAAIASALPMGRRRKRRREVAEVARREQAAALLETSIPHVMVSEAVTPAETRILARGNWMDESGEIVTPAIPGFLGKLDTGGRRATRLDLANWLVRPDNPLTARVTVNRMWRQFFGIGLSKALDDLGSQGEWPTHPELLDWLASEFVHPAYQARERACLGREASDPHHRDQPDLPAVFDEYGRNSTSAIPTTACWPGRAASVWKPKSSATSRCRFPDCWWRSLADRAPSRTSPMATWRR